MTLLLLVVGLTILGWVVGLLITRSPGRRPPVEPLPVIADRVLAQLRSLPETREHETPGHG